MALISLSASLSLVVYSGRSSTLKQVWAEGRRSQSGPFRAITSFKWLSPPTGTRSDPVVNCSNLRLSSNEKPCTMLQKSFIVCESAV